MTLSQTRLDVVDKDRSSLFGWRGQFTPQFVDYILECYANEDTKVLDPFAGSGTLLLECARKNIECAGGEINPAAYAMSKFFTLSSLSFDDRYAIISDVTRIFSELLIHVRLEATAKELVDEIEALNPDPQTRLFLVNVFLLAESGKDAINRRIISSAKRLEKILIALPKSQKSISMHLCDARMIHRRVSEYDLIITSPPYINVFNYHQNYRATLELWGWDLLAVAQSEFGANRKHRANRFKTVIQYAIDMEQTLLSLRESLVVGGKLVMVVGRRSNVRGVPFYNGQIIEDVVKLSRSFDIESRYARKFLNRFGESICEDILILTRIADDPVEDMGRNVAEAHLTRALNSSDAPLADISEALSQIATVKQSPLLSNIFKPNHEPHAA